MVVNKSFWVALALAVIISDPVTIRMAHANDSSIHIRNPGGDHDINCRGRTIVISGASNDVRLTNCPDVIVSGASNNVWIEGASAVKVPGASNNVRANYASDGWIQVNGSTNDVEITAARRFKVQMGNKGVGNRLSRKYD